MTISLDIFFENFEKLLVSRKFTKNLLLNFIGENP
jgi:hypothetical protein